LPLVTELPRTYNVLWLTLSLDPVPRRDIKISDNVDTVTWQKGHFFLIGSHSHWKVLSTHHRESIVIKIKFFYRKNFLLVTQKCHYKKNYFCKKSTLLDVLLQMSGILGKNFFLTHRRDPYQNTTDSASAECRPMSWHCRNYSYNFTILYSWNRNLTLSGKYHCQSTDIVMSTMLLHGTEICWHCRQCHCIVRS
jgi:hypothetical protein